MKISVWEDDMLGCNMIAPAGKNKRFLCCLLLSGSFSYSPHMTSDPGFHGGTRPLPPDGLAWQERVLMADAIWAQAAALLGSAGVQLSTTPRCPDVRLILNNISGRELRFFNPGDHSGNREEIVPAQGEKTAAMLMVAGENLLEQVDHAARLFRAYELGRNGLSPAFVADLRSGRLTRPSNLLVREAYGPTSFAEQVGKLVDATWPQANHACDLVVRSQQGAAGAFGTRAATHELALLCEFPIYIKGTTTIAEKVESDGMVIVMEENRQTGIVSTRPVVPSMARGFYGGHYDLMPRAQVDAGGILMRLALSDGTVLLPGSPPLSAVQSASLAITES